MPQPESTSESQFEKELRDLLGVLLDLHDGKLTSWVSQFDSEEVPPEWVFNAMERLWSPYLQWLVGMEEAEPSLENMGKLVGALKFATENAMNLTPILAWHRRWGNLKRAKRIFRPLRIIMASIRRTIQGILRRAHEFPSHETADFFQGFNIAMRHNLVDREGKPIIKNDATKLYLFLIMFWKTVDKMQSVPQLHKWLGKFFPQNELSDIERLRGICKKIKLHLGKRGRPKNQKK
jgi:hypothetical protein